MKRALRRHQKQVAKARRIRILKTHGAWKVREPFSSSGLVDWTWKPKPWRPMSSLVMNEPGWWCHERMVVPARIRSRRIEHRIERGTDPDACCWPDYRKPHDYYW
jgi:hypothetical protein